MLNLLSDKHIVDQLIEIIPGVIERTSVNNAAKLIKLSHADKDQSMFACEVLNNPELTEEVEKLYKPWWKS